METGIPDMAMLQGRTAAIADVLGAIANERRLRLLCRLATAREATVTDLAVGAGLSPSATSQHLARMRDQAIVDFRREGRTLWYRLADPRIERLLATLQHLFCAPPDASQTKG